jgi:hypothetical protein
MALRVILVQQEPIPAMELVVMIVLQMLSVFKDHVNVLLAHQEQNKM